LPNKSIGPEYVGEGELVGDVVGVGISGGVGNGRTDGVGFGVGLAFDWLAVLIAIPALQIKLCFFFWQT